MPIDIDTLAIEVQRVKDMIQTLSESHDLNRRELREATARANALSHDITVLIDELNPNNRKPL